MARKGRLKGFQTAFDVFNVNAIKIVISKFIKSVEIWN